MREPDYVGYIPLWEVNHSKERLIKEETRNATAYLLGYEMQEEVDDPAKKAYKHFSNELYPHGNVLPEGHALDFNPRKPVWVVADFNRAPHCWALMQVRQFEGEKVYVVFDELFSVEALTSEQSKRMVKKLHDLDIPKVILAGDNTSNQRAGKYGRFGKNDWEIVKEEFREGGIKFTTKLRIQNPKRKVRVDFINLLINNALPDQRRRMRFFVMERCEYVIKDYQFSITDEAGLKIDDGFRGHMSDACDYGVWAESNFGDGIKYSLGR